MKLLKNEKGQSIVEFALIMPLLLLILCGIIDFGWMFYNKLSLESCTRDCARYGAVNAANSDCVSLVGQKAADTILSSLKDNMTVTVTFSVPNEPCEGDITVYVTTHFNVLTPVLGIFCDGQQMTISSKVTMKAES